jgi:hypothetical protein
MMRRAMWASPVVAALVALGQPADAAPSASQKASLAGSLPGAAALSVAASSTGIVTVDNTRMTMRLRLGVTINAAAVSVGINSFAGGKSVVASDVIWDGTSGRFYFALAATDSTNGYLAFGWSKNANPLRAGDWCAFSQSLGNVTVFNPTVGDTTNRVLIGYNRFNRSTGAFIASDLVGTPKPASGGSTCPAGPAFTTTTNLTSASGAQFYGPAAANQIDAGTVGYVVARPLTLPATQIGLLRVSETGGAAASTYSLTKLAVTVGSYNLPPGAAQLAATNKLGTGGAEFPRAVLAAVPRNGGGLSLFTQHTVANGTTPAVDWFELNPSGTPSIRRSGRITNAFNGAISSNRNSGGTSGNDLAVIYSNSSSTLYPRVRVLSSINGAVATSTQIAAASAPLFAQTNFPCGRPGGSGGDTCAFGGANAAPDPLSAQIFGTAELPAGTTPPPVDTQKFVGRLYQIVP